MWLLKKLENLYILCILCISESYIFLYPTYTCILYSIYLLLHSACTLACIFSEFFVFFFVRTFIFFILCILGTRILCTLAFCILSTHLVSYVAFHDNLHILYPMYPLNLVSYEHPSIIVCTLVNIILHTLSFCILWTLPSLYLVHACTFYPMYLLLLSYESLQRVSYVPVYPLSLGLSYLVSYVILWYLVYYALLLLWPYTTFYCICLWTVYPLVLFHLLSNISCTPFILTYKNIYKWIDNKT